MASFCRVCASPLSGGSFCPICGSEQPAPASEPGGASDPLIGRTLLGRYEITELLNVGGMGLVYRAVHRPLDRTVAVKLIHPQLVVDEQIVSRFLVEAQIASRLNHPNIVSIHDFGRTPAAEGGDLILVMELLTGPSLSTLVHEEERLPIPRIADILCQTLGALGEAHFHGVVHRDVKPANIHIEPERRGGERVKLIDFGIARIGKNPRLTLAGQVLGTPSYMAPEQRLGGRVGPAADLYAVGVLLFRMLTGRLPFTGPGDAILAQQRLAPNPREVAPELDIPEALAAVCVRALSYEASDRYASAEELAQAVLEAAGAQHWTDKHSSLFRQRSSSEPELPSRASSPTEPASPAAKTPPTGERIREDPTPWEGDRPSEEPTDPLPLFRRRRLDLPSLPPTMPLVGRRDDLLWASGQIEGFSDAAGFILWGRPGVGRTRLLDEVCAAASLAGAVVVRVAPVAPPLNEVSYGGLRSIITRLAGAPSWHPLLVSGKAARTPLEFEGLRVAFDPEWGSTGAGSRSLRRAAGAALAWAARAAAEAAQPARLLIAVDDADIMDGPSRAALVEVLAGDPLPGVSFVVTSERAPERRLSAEVPARELEGLSHDDAARLLGDPRFIRMLGPEVASVEPLYVEQLLQWAVDQGPSARPPAGLVPLIEARLENLAPAPRRALQLVAVTGGGNIDALAAIAPDRESFLEGVLALATVGLLEVRGREVVLPHAIFGRVAVAMAPGGAVAELHARAAEALVRSPLLDDLRAYHAIQGRPDLPAFLIVEESARRRAAYGDEEGAIALLWEGLRAARALSSHGDVDGLSGALLFGQKLGRALADAGRLDEAVGVVTETLGLLGPHDLRRVIVLEQLAAIAAQRGRYGDADAFRREAQEIGNRTASMSTGERSTWRATGASSTFTQRSAERRLPDTSPVSPRMQGLRRPTPPSTRGALLPRDPAELPPRRATDAEARIPNEPLRRATDSQARSPNEPPPRKPTESQPRRPVEAQPISSPGRMPRRG